MTIFTLGSGKYAVAHSILPNGKPALTVRRLPKPEEVGTVLEGETRPGEEFDLIIQIETPQAAIVLLTIAQTIAFAHGVNEKEMQDPS